MGRTRIRVRDGAQKYSYWRVVPLLSERKNEFVGIGLSKISLENFTHFSFSPKRVLLSIEYYCSDRIPKFSIMHCMSRNFIARSRETRDYRVLWTQEC